MPTIRPYQQAISSQADIPGRRAGASDFSTADPQAGAGLQSLGASLYDMAERSEVSDAHARLATARAEWTVHLQERAQAAAPGDPNFASNFNQDLAKYLEKSGGYATAAGSRAYQQGSAELAAHFVQSAGVFQARSMGEKAKQDYGTIVNQNGLSVYTDPTQFDSLNKSQRAAIFDPSSIYFRVGGPEREELAKNGEQLLARNALKGLINISPELAQKQLTEGAGAAAFINAKDRDALDSEAKRAIQVREEEKRRLDMAADKEDRKRLEANARSATDLAIAGKLTGPQLLKMEMDDGSKRAIFSFMKATAGEGDHDAKAYGPGFNNMVKRVWDGDPTNNPTEQQIMMMSTDATPKSERITTSGARELIGQLRGKGTAEGSAEATMKKEFFQVVEAQISPKVFGLPTSPRAQAQYGYYVQWALPEYERLRKEGKTTDEIMGPKGALTLGAERFKISQTELFADMVANAPADPTQSGKFLGSRSAPPARATVKIAPLTVTTQAEYDALPAGAEYVDPKDVKRRKAK